MQTREKLPPVLADWPVARERVVNAVEKIFERRDRVTALLEQAGIAYAVIGGNAVGVWVGRVDESLVRFTRDVDILLRRADLLKAQAVLEGAGFIFRHVRGVDMFLDGPNSKVGDAVHVLFAGEDVRASQIMPNPDVADSEPADGFRVLSLPALVQMKLTAFRRKDQVHLEDMIQVGLIDQTWPVRYPPELAQRLQYLLDNPESGQEDSDE